MHLSWLGQTCIKLQTKNNDTEATILFDAYKPKKGDFPRSLAADIALFSKGQENALTISQEPFTIDTLGEFDIKGSMVTTWGTPEGVVCYKVTTEGVHVLHLGRIKTKISAEIIESVGKVDVLLIPVGGGENYLSASDAASIITELEPRIVIPIAYQSDNDPDAASVESFIKEVGLKPEVTDKKIILKQKDLPVEETKLMILEKQ
jgi:L-ascorbate metabolism protein UlaG (beta-lactamase superfamily)